MRIRSVRHRGLRRLVENNDSRGISGDLLRRVRGVVTALILADSVETISATPGWRIHRLTGERAGTWSISVSGNWRITFDIADGEILHLNLEDYH